MSPKIGDGFSEKRYVPDFWGLIFSPKGYVPDFRGRFFRYKAMSPKIGNGFSEKRYVPDFWGRFFSAKRYVPEYEVFMHRASPVCLYIGWLYTGLALCQYTPFGYTQG